MDCDAVKGYGGTSQTERKADAGAFAMGIWSDAQTAAMENRDLPHHREAKSHAAARIHAALRIEGGKEQSLYIGMDTLSAVTDVDQEQAILLFRKNGDPAPLRGVGHGIGEKVI